MRVPPTICMLLLSACGPADQTRQLQEQSNQIAGLKSQLAQRDAMLADLKAEAQRLKVAPALAGSGNVNDGREEAPKEAVAKAPQSRYPNNCFKDYCPCDPPQGGPDSVLCDQLEAGENVDLDL